MEQHTMDYSELHRIPNQKFPLGWLVITQNAETALSEREITETVIRHATGDWGNLCEQDRDENEQSLENGRRLFSSYTTRGITFWVITEADRSVTTVLLPVDY